MDKKTKEFYERLKKELKETSIWPSEYLFKFIVPSEQKNIERIENSFNNMGAVIETKESKKGKYTSVSVNVSMETPEHVIEKYIEMSNIEGIVSL